MKWLVVESHDERYDFNLQIKTFEGTLEEFENSIECDFSKEDREEMRDGIYVYRRNKRTKRTPSGINDETWNRLKDHLDLVDFSTLCLIPFENFNDLDFVFQDGIVSRNVKFGFLDLVSNR